MKIALFTDSYVPYVSGVVRSVQLLKKELEALGNEVFLFAPKYPGFLDTEKNIVRLPSFPLGYPGFRIPVALPGAIPDIPFDIVHSNSPFGLGRTAMKFAKRHGIPFVFTFHTRFTDYAHYVPLPKVFTRLFLYNVIKRFCNKCDRIIAPNKNTAEYIKNYGVKTAIEQIPSGIDEELSRKASSSGIRAELGIPDDAPVLLFVGRLSKEKNIPFLFSAFKTVLSARNDARLLIVAGGPIEEGLKTLSASMGISGNTVFAGQKPYPRVLDYFKAGDIFVFSSKSETQGLVIAEAKACGLPVVAVDSYGINDSVENGRDGFLVPENINEFAGKILLLLNDPGLRERMSASAAKDSVRDFSSKNVAKKVLSVYNSLKR